MSKVFVVMLFILSFAGCGTDSKKLEEKYNKGMTLFAKNDRAGAIKIFSEIYKEDPDYKDTLFNLGKLYYYELNFKEATKYFRELYKKDTDNLNVLLWVIKAQFAGKVRDKDFFDNLQFFSKRDNGNLEALMIGGMIMEEVGKTDLAIQHYNQIVMQTGQIALAHRHLATIYGKAKLSEKAAFHLKKFESLIGKD
ncbi:hypothetical protein EHO60_03250 [Leptospira fletcheri]|uniref:Uncharacterized protein n=1 Tax=Leptospira fletcheri TaxID=2484981 RepID=A0A4R9GIX3_9LEPT|nr:tetratricopeptide repeat protein [Leptospira fletcheri]TGK12904.1 hypothetical protein EHO60_03250 [Leptospira fletcheri]